MLAYMASSTTNLAFPQATYDDSMLEKLSRSRQTPYRPWSKTEDSEIVALVGKYGPRRWSLIASSLPGRKGKQCRERWYNQLDPNINTLPWTDSEDFVLMQAHHKVLNSFDILFPRYPLLPITNPSCSSTETLVSATSIY